MDAGRLLEILTPICPGIDAISIGRAADKRTWRITFLPEATPEQRLACQATIDALDPDAVDLQEIKKEASKRILARYPDWKQRNMTARGVELVFTLVKKGWTKEEEAEAAELQAAWDEIKAVRAASDALEAMPTVPKDFTDAKHWPTERARPGAAEPSAPNRRP